MDQWKAKEVARLLAVVETERRYYQEIVATLPVGLLVVAPDLSIVSANRAFRRLLDLRTEDVLRRRLEDVLPLESLATQVTEVLAGAGQRLNLLFEYAGEKGAKPLRISIAGLRSWEEEGDLEALLVVEDLTGVEQPKRAEPAPVQPPPAASFENLAAGVWECDPATLEFTFLNSRVQEMLGFGEEQFREPVLWMDLIHPNDRERMTEFYRGTAREAAGRMADYRVSGRGGRIIWLRDAVRPLEAGRAEAARLIGVTVDISAHRKTEEHRLQSQKMESLGRVASRIAHDFNNLLMIIQGYGEDLLNGFPARDPRRSDVEEILRTSDRVSVLTAQLAAFTRRAAETVEIDLNAVIGRLEPKLRARAGETCRLELALQPNLGAVMASAQYMEQAIAGLVANAAMSVPEGGMLTVETANVDLASGDAPVVAGLEPGGYVLLRTRDAATVMDADARLRLFEPVLAPHAAGKETPASLFTVYGAVRQAGGDVWVESEPGPGTTISLYLPRVAPAVEEVAAPPEAAEVAPAEPQEVPAPIVEAQTVLVVEDDAGVRALVRKILERQGYAVIEAASGVEALRLGGEHAGAISLLVTDLTMPELSGRELAEQLRAARPGMRVLYVSGYTDDPAIHAGIFPPGTAYLQKPFTLGALLDKVRGVLAQEIGGPQET